MFYLSSVYPILPCYIPYMSCGSGSPNHIGIFWREIKPAMWLSLAPLTGSDSVEHTVYTQDTLSN